MRWSRTGEKSLKESNPQGLTLFFSFGTAAGFSPHISQRSSREVGKGCEYEMRVEKHPEAYCQYVEDVFQAKRSRRNA